MGSSFFYGNSVLTFISRQRMGLSLTLQKEIIFFNDFPKSEHVSKKTRDSQEIIAKYMRSLSLIYSTDKPVIFKLILYIKIIPVSQRVGQHDHFYHYSLNRAQYTLIY